MAYNVFNLQLGPWKETHTHGTGSGDIYVCPMKSADGVVDCVMIYSAEAPSTTDTYNIGSLWVCITAGSVKMYVKTAATTWTVVGAQS